MRGDVPCDSKVWDADGTSFPRLRERTRRLTHETLSELMSRCLDGDWEEHIGSLELPVFHVHVMLCGESLRLHIEPAALSITWPVQ